MLNLMKKYSFIFLFLVAFAGYSQDYSDPQNIKVTRSQEAHYPKGEDALYKYFFDCIYYTEEAIKNEVESEVMLSFTVGFDSTITNIKVITGPGFGVDDEVKRCLSKLKYAPALENGVKMRSQQMLTVPVRAYKRK
jgi:TonB family protein